MRIARLRKTDWSEADQSAEKVGWETTNRLRRRGTGWAADSFLWQGRCPFQRKDRVLPVFDEGDGRVMVEPLATVVHVRRYKVRGRTHAIVYIEFREARRRSLQRFAKQLGHGAERTLKRGGLVRDAEFANAVRHICEK